MSTIDRIKKIQYRYNPLTVRRRNMMRKKLINSDITFLCPNCIGGLLFHDLGLKFLSPTVNLMLTQVDFVKFVMNLDYYLMQEFEFYIHPYYAFPCAKLKDLDIYFTHYKTKEEAEKKWKERVKRIKRDNIFVFLEERDGLNKEHILQLKKLSVRGVLVFTANNYSEIPYALQIPKYKKTGEIGNILKMSYINGSREYEKFFDFVKWFNEANEEDYNISNYVK